MPTKVTKAKPSAPVKAPKTKFRMHGTRKSKMTFPMKRKEPITDISKYSMLIYGRKKIGKSTLFSTFPNIRFLTTETGTKGLEIYEFNEDGGGITCWEEMLEAVGLIEENRNLLDNALIDTADQAYKQCMAWVCKKAGVDHPHDANDYGKTWNRVSDEFSGVFHRIQRAGVGLCLTSHSRVSEIESSTGQKFSRIGPSLPGSAEGLVLALVDFIFYIEYMRDVDGNTRRVIITDGDELVIAGQRKIGGQSKLPTFIPLPEDESRDYDVLAAAFRGEDVGIDPARLMPAKTTSKAGKAFVQRKAIDAKKGGKRAKR